MEKIDNGRDSRFCVKKLQKNGEYFFLPPSSTKRQTGRIHDCGNCVTFK